jgi:tryptophan synthase alpha chain
LSRLTTRINEIASTNGKSLVAYIVAGDPVLEVTVRLMQTLVEAGVDIIELGVPFSDPEAEGPVIQLAHERALQTSDNSRAVSLKDTFAIVQEFRETNDVTPIILMGYLNPIEIMGYETFAKTASQAGVDGTIIVNLPPEEAGSLSTALEENDIDSVYLLAPTTTDERAAFITSRSKGFVYYVSLKGTTGASSLNVQDVKEKLSRFRSISNLPIMVGFGIKDAETAAKVAAISDGVVVGSAIVQLIGDNVDEPEVGMKKIAELISGMRKSIDES